MALFIATWDTQFSRSSLKKGDSRMKRKALLLGFFIISCAISPTGTLSDEKAAKSETPHLVFVQEYIIGLIRIERMDAAAMEELKNDPNQSTIQSVADSLHTHRQSEMRVQILNLKKMQLNSPFEKLIPKITELYERRIALLQKSSDLSHTFREIQGVSPQQHLEIIKQLKEITDELENVDDILEETTPLIFATLVEDTPEQKGHVVRLIITQSERKVLINELVTNFGAELSDRKRGLTPIKAAILNAYFLNDFRCSDEPSD
jgi:hypothetical protein